MSRWMYSVAFQWLSLFSALLLSGLILLFPNVLMPEEGRLSHGFLSLCMLGISAGFVFGVGFIPRNKFLSWLLGPYLAWGLMIGSYVYLLAR